MPNTSLRRKAQVLLDAMSNPQASTPNGYTLRQLVEELHIHQIELEIQNEELRATTQELEDAQRFQRQLFALAPTGHLLLDHEGVIKEINETACGYFKLTDNVLLGQRLSSFVPHGSNVTYQNYMKSLSLPGGPRQVELQLRNRLQEDFWVRMEAVPINAPHSLKPFLLCSLHEISAEKAAEKILLEEKKQLRAQLRQAHKMEAVGTLAGGIAHSFNNLLAVIIGSIDMAMEEIPFQERKRFLDRSLTAAFRARDLVKQILAFSRRQEDRRQPILIQDLIYETMAMLDASTPASVGVAMEIDPRPATVLADSAQLQQLLMNLCTNAIHSMEEKGRLLVALRSMEVDEHRAATILALQPGNYVRLSVIDSGPGIMPEHLEQIFDPFFTTKEVGKGTGMGLAVAHGVAQSHGGTITVESVEGQGATFHVWLPVMAGEVVTTEGEGEDAVRGGSEKILLVDDDRHLLELGKLSLERYGYSVVATSNSAHALKLFGEAPDAFDLVITDQTMPEMTGDELVQEIFALRSGQPVILCTGFSTRVDQERAHLLGVRGFIMKPFMPHELASLIRDVLDKSPSPHGSRA